jgi:hypothetical protein
LLVGAGDTGVRRWEAGGLRELPPLIYPAGVLSVAFDFDGTQLVACGMDQRLVLWRDCAAGAPVAGEIVAVLPRRMDPMTRASFSPDGARLALALNYTVRLWDTARYVELLALRDAEGGSACVAFSPDGTQLVQGPWTGGGIRVLDTVPEPERSRQREALRAAEPEAARVLAAALGVEPDVAVVGRRLREDQSLDSAVRRVALNILLARCAGARREQR